MAKFLQDFNNILETQYKDFVFIGEGDLSNVSSILGQNTYHNIIYAGKSGVGKTANLLGLVQHQCLDPEYSVVSLPLHMFARKFYLLDNSQLFAGSDEQIRANIQMMFDELKRPGGDNVLVIEDANDFLAAIEDHGVPGVISSFMSELRKNSFQCIWMVREVAGSTRMADVINCHSDIEELFTILRKEPADKDEIVKIIDSRRQVLEKYHEGLTVPAESAKEVAELTVAYPSLAIYQREQPARAVRMLDSIASTFLTEATIDNNQDPKWIEVMRSLQSLNQRRIEVETAKQQARTELDSMSENLTETLRQEMGQAPNRRELDARKTSDMRNCEQVIAAANADLNNHILPEIQKLNKEINVSLTLDASAVRSIFSKLSGIPSSDLSDNEAQLTLQLEQRMLNKVFGQDHAVQTVAGAIKRAKAGLKDPKKPIGGFILLGSSGVGKSYLGEVLAQVLFNDSDNMTSFDMSEFMEKHTVSKLIGAPPGYAGYGSGGALTNSVRHRPHQVILLDEIEKAHPDVFKILLQVLDKGRLSDELGTVDFSNVILLLTTNLAQHLSLDDNLDVGSPDVREDVIEELRKIFPQELINRVDDFLLFKALLNEHIEKIIHREIKKINKNLAKRTLINVNISDDDIRKIVIEKYKREEGSRQVLKFIGNQLERKVADVVLSHPEGGTINATYNGSGFDLELKTN